MAFPNTHSAGLADGGPSILDISALSSRKISGSENQARFIVPFMLFVVAASVGIKGVIMGNDSDVPQAVAVPLAIAALLFLVVMLFRAVQRAALGARGASKKITSSRLAASLKLQPLDVTLSEAVSRVKATFGQASLINPKRAPSRTGASVLYLLAFLLGIVVTFVAGFLTAHFIDRFLGIAVSLIGGTLSYKLLVLSRRAGQPTADALIEADTRPPVLLLRSFKDDRMQVSQRITSTVEQDTQIEFEEGLATRLKEFGPFIGIGAPGESLPQMGAARAYLPDDKWQEAVIAWMEGARLIAMIAGHTPWVHWELEQIVTRGQCGKLIVFLPPRAKVSPPDDRALRWQQILAPLQGTPWAAQLAAIEPKDLLAVTFPAPGHVFAVRGATELMQDYETALIACCYAAFCRP